MVGVRRGLRGATGRSARPRHEDLEFEEAAHPNHRRFRESSEHVLLVTLGGCPTPVLSSPPCHVRQVGLQADRREARPDGPSTYLRTGLPPRSPPYKGLPGGVGAPAVHRPARMQALIQGAGSRPSSPASLGVALRREAPRWRLPPRPPPHRKSRPLPPRRGETGGNPAECDNFPQVPFGQWVEARESSDRRMSRGRCARGGGLFPNVGGRGPLPLFPSPPGPRSQSLFVRRGPRKPRIRWNCCEESGPSTCARSARS